MAQQQTQTRTEETRTPAVPAVARPGMGSLEGIGALLELAQVRGKLEDFLPSGLQIKRFMSLVVLACQKTPGLMRCNQLSFLRAVTAAAELGLEPNSALGHGWLIPYKEEATFIPGYKGLVTIAHRTGSVKSLWARVVYRGETFEVHDGTDPKIIHRPNLEGPQEDGDVVAAYAVAEMHDGAKLFEVMPLKKILAVRNRSSGWRVKGEASTWGTDFQEMARKTPTRKLAKYLPIENPQWARLLEVDNEDYEESEMDRLVRRSRPLRSDQVVDAEFTEGAGTPATPAGERAPAEGKVDGKQPARPPPEAAGIIPVLVEEVKAMAEQYAKVTGTPAVIRWDEIRGDEGLLRGVIRDLDRAVRAKLAAKVEASRTRPAAQGSTRGPATGTSTEAPGAAGRPAEAGARAVPSAGQILANTVQAPADDERKALLFEAVKVGEELVKLGKNPGIDWDILGTSPVETVRAIRDDLKLYLDEVRSQVAAAK